MPPPDWKRADQFRSQADEPGADRGLAHRLSRLPSSHPSAWPAPDYAGPEYRERDREEWWRPAADAGSADSDENDADPNDTEWADTEPDDADLVPDDRADEPEAVPPGDEADPERTAGAPSAASRPAAPARGGRRPEASAGWGELGGTPARTRYRPWFSAEGAADPWFAVRETK